MSVFDRQLVTQKFSLKVCFNYHVLSPGQHEIHPNTAPFQRRYREHVGPGKTSGNVMSAGASSPDALVSVVTPMYNAAEFIGQMIDSVLSQTYQNFELILVDDCSTDGTCDSVRQYRDARICLIENPRNLGAGESRNVAVRAARGRYIAFLDADDLWHPEKLRMQVSCMRANGIAFLYSRFDLIDANGRVFANSGRLPLKADYHQILRHNWIRTSSAIYDTRLTGGKVYFPSIRKRQDMILFLDIIKRSGPAQFLDECTCSYRVHDNSISASKLRLIPFQWTAYRQVEGLSFFYSSYLMAYWFARAGLKTLRRRLMGAVS